MIIRRKSFLNFLALLFSVFVLFGCGEKEETVSAKRQTLQLWHYWDQKSVQNALRELVDSFNESQDKYELTLRYIPDADFKKQLALATADNQAPDMAMVDLSDLRYYDDMQQFADLSEVIEESWDEYYEPLRAICQIDGRIAGLPFGMNLLAMYYNVDALEEAGIQPPKTMEEFTAAAQALTTAERYGFAMSAIQSEESIYNFLPILWNAGGNVDELESENSKNAFEIVHNMAEQGCISRQCINLTLGDVSRQFAEGNVAMMFNTGMVEDNIREINPELNFAVTYLPTDPKFTVLGGEILTVSDNGVKEGAMEFIRYVSDVDWMQSHIDDYGMVAPREDVAANQYSDNEIKQFFSRYLSYAAARERTADWPKISGEVTTAISESVIGELDIDVILSDAAQNISDIREGKE